MSDEIKNAENEMTKVEPSAELPEAALDQVAGGITKVVDKASPKLYEAVCTGAHLPKAEI